MRIKNGYEKNHNTEPDLPFDIKSKYNKHPGTLISIQLFPEFNEPDRAPDDKKDQCIGKNNTDRDPVAL